MVYETPNGDSWVKGFAESGVCFASVAALEEDGLTSFSSYAVVESCIHQIDYRVLLRLAGQHIAWQRAIAYSARTRTPFRCDGGQHSAVMADTIPR